MDLSRQEDKAKFIDFVKENAEFIHMVYFCLFMGEKDNTTDKLREVFNHMKILVMLIDMGKFHFAAKYLMEETEIDLSSLMIPERQEVIKRWKDVKYSYLKSYEKKYIDSEQQESEGSGTSERGEDNDRSEK